jgi:hypothetical protein
LLNLNDQIDPQSGWKLSEAHAINELGQIVGRGTNSLGIEQGFLLSRTDEALVVAPINEVPEPGTLLLMAVGMGAAGVLSGALRQVFRSANSAIRVTRKSRARMACFYCRR